MAGIVAGKVIMVTGAGKGIGRATAERIVAEGGKVIAADRDAAAATALAEHLGSACTGIVLDVTETASWDNAIDGIKQEHGRLDGMVNNAGILATSNMQDLDNLDMAEWRAVLDVNLDGVLHGCRHAVRMMAADGIKGSIVNLSSIAGIIGTPFFVAYGASKGAVRQMTKTVALHCGRLGNGIRCNSVHPGVIDTDMGTESLAMGGRQVEESKAARVAQIPLGRVGTATDVANCILFLLSDQAAYVNGAELVVDGGFTIT